MQGLMIDKFCLILILMVTCVLSENKYSKHANEKKKTDIDFRKIQKPFRINKLNILWVKAQQRLSEPKLQSLYSDLMLHDKEELTLKRVKLEGGDKEGYREADLRRKLTIIMSNYGLREHFEDVAPVKQKEHSAYNSATDDHINKSLFKDKKLNKLWSKAEASGFTSEELAALREEFMHHQDKIDQYYELLNDVDQGKKDGYRNAVNDEELDEFNEITKAPEADKDDDDLFRKANAVRAKHNELKDGYDKLQRITARGPDNKDFIEPKVQGLWRMATAANFTADELESIKVELHHYENRLLKLRTLHADRALSEDKHRTKVAAAGDKVDHLEHQEQMIKKHSRQVDKMHEDLESRILQRHNEL